MKILYLLISILLAASCHGQEFKTELIVYNKSGRLLDSVKVYDVLGRHKMYYDVKPETNIKINHSGLWSEVPRGERGVFSIVVFDKGQYYWDSTGFIGFPGTTIEDKYELYIYPEYISEEKDFYPDRRSDKKKISEYISGN